MFGVHFTNRMLFVQKWLHYVHENAFQIVDNFFSFVFRGGMGVTQFLVQIPLLKNAVYQGTNRYFIRHFFLLRPIVMMIACIQELEKSQCYKSRFTFYFIVIDQKIISSCNSGKDLLESESVSSAPLTENADFLSRYGFYLYLICNAFLT